jgi:hypothetical protein
MLFRDHVSCHAYDSYSARSKRSTSYEPRLPEPTALSASYPGSLCTATAATTATETAAPKQHEHGPRKLSTEPPSNAPDV